MSKTIERTVEIAASPKRVWTVLTDFAKHAEWNPFIRQISGSGMVGDRLQIQVAPPGGRQMRFRPVVTAASPGRELAWLGHLGARGFFDGAHSFTIEDLGNGRTALTQAETFSGVLVPLFISGLDRTAEGFDQMNGALKQRCESTMAFTPTITGPTNDEPDRPLVAIALAAGLGVVTVFQVALTLGAPLGAAAFGGTNPAQLPDGVRIVTGLSAALWLFGALLVLARGGRALVRMPEAVSRAGSWVLVGLLGVGALLNFASSSPWERFGWGPFTLVLFILGILLARSGSDRSAPRAL